MNEIQVSTDPNRLYIRFIALWILSEAFLGGVVHGLKLPVSGLLIGGCAGICICLIAWFVPVRGALLKATLVVAIFKMMLSPHSPPAAYIAVFFQGILGEFLLRNRRLFGLMCLIFGILIMAESALQRILVLTLIYGTDFWEALDMFVLKVSGDATVQKFSISLAIGYVLMHLVVGAVLGSLTWRLIRKTALWNETEWIIEIPQNLSMKAQISREQKPAKILKSGLLLIWLFLLAAFIQSVVQPKSAWLPANAVLAIVLRSILILLTWYLILSPLLMRYLHLWLNKQKAKSSAFIGEVVAILPEVQYLVSQSWDNSHNRKGPGRFLLFCKILLINILH